MQLLESEAIGVQGTVGGWRVQLFYVEIVGIEGTWGGREFELFKFERRSVGTTVGDRGAWLRLPFFDMIELGIRNLILHSSRIFVYCVLSLLSFASFLLEFGHSRVF